MLTAGMSYWDAITPTLVIAALAIAALPWLDRKNAVVRSIVIGIGLLLGWRYMIWRVTETIPPLGDPVDFLAGLIFVTVEALAMIGSTASQIFLTRTVNRTADVDRALPLFLAQPKLPRVDVLICTYNEDETILERTIVGALAMKYPNYRVWVCDDGRRQWLSELCARHEVGYLTRKDNAHAKAGNINAALDVLAALPEKPDFISILDADFVPLPDFLTRALTLTMEPDVGVVQTPQHFFNPDPIQTNLSLTRVWPDEQRFFFDVVMAAKDAWGAAFCCGTSSVIRFEALRGIGGFPTDSVTEDYLVSLRLRERGFRTLYLNEVLSLGLAPEGLKEYTVQRSRWCLGFVQICRGKSGPLKLGNGLPLVDRIMLCETFLHWSATHLFRMLGIIVPSLYLVFNVEAVHANVIDAIWHLAPFIVAQGAIFFWLTEGRVLPLMSDLYQMLCATEVLKAVWAGLLRPKGQKFKVTAKGGDRSKTFVQWPLMRVFGGLLVMALVGIAVAFVIDPTRPLAESSALALFWSWYNILILTLACLVCREQQQRRNGDRFEVQVPVKMLAGGRLHEFMASDLSVSGMHILGTPPDAVGAAVRVRFENVILDATLCRKTQTGFGLKFRSDVGSKGHLLRFIFSGRHSTERQIRPVRVAKALAVRVLS